MDMNGSSKIRLRNISERKIVEALEKGEGRFTDIKERVDISKPTLSKNLQKLEKRSIVERYYSEGDIIIKLAEDQKDPIIKTLRRLDRITESLQLDLEKGLDLLTKEGTVDTILEIYKCIKKPPEWIYNLSTGESEPYEVEFNEEVFLTALAHYMVESDFICQPTIIFDGEEAFRRRVRGKIDNPDYFPVTAAIKRRGPEMEELFDELSDWADPLKSGNLAALVLDREANICYDRLEKAFVQK